MTIVLDWEALDTLSTQTAVAGSLASGPVPLEASISLAVELAYDMQDGLFARQDLRDMIASSNLR